MINGEGVLKVPDGEQQRHELPERQDQGDGEAGALGGEDEDGRNANVLSDDIKGQVAELDGDGEAEDDHGGGVGQDVEMAVDVAGQEDESGKGQAMRIEQGFFGMLAVGGVDDFLIDAHPGRHQEGEDEHGDADGEGQPFDEPFPLVVAGSVNLLAGHDGAEGHPDGDAQDGQIFGRRVPPSQQHHAQEHVSDEGSGPEDHVERHGDAEVEGVVVHHADGEVHGHHLGVGADGDFGGDRAEPGGEDEALQGDEEERGDGDDVAHPLVILDQQLQKHHVAGAANKDDQDGQEDSPRRHLELSLFSQPQR